MVVDLILQLLLPLLYFETFTFKYKLAALLTLYFSSRSISFTFIVRMILKSKLIVTINAELHNGHDCFTKPCCTKAGSQIALAILQDSISSQELSLALLYLVEFQLGWYKRVQKNVIGELSFFIWSLWGACGILKTFQINLLHIIGVTGTGILLADWGGRGRERLWAPLTYNRTIRPNHLLQN